MKNVFEKIKERLEEETYDMEICEEQFDANSSYFIDVPYKMVKLEDALSIVSEVEAEYINKSTEHINKSSDCSTNCSTNGDKIRSMSDEELAEFLPIVSNCLCRPTDECMNTIFNRVECEKTKECALDWIKSPTND